MLAGLEFPGGQWVAGFCFLGALFHSLFTHRFLTEAKAMAGGAEQGSSKHLFYEVFGHLTFIFALWLTPVFLLIWLNGGSELVVQTFYHADFTEPFSNFTFMFLAFSPTVRGFFQRLVTRVARIFGSSDLAWWSCCLLLGVTLDGIISEAAAIILVASAIGNHFFSRQPSARFCYACFAILVAVLALGSLVIPFNLTASMDLTSEWGWSHWTIAQNLSWRALIVVLAIIGLGGQLLKSEFRQLSPSTTADEDSEPLLNGAVIGYFLAFLVCGFMEQIPVVLITVVAFVCVLEGAGSKPMHNERLFLPLLIALFNYSMELHAYFLSDIVGSIYSNVAPAGHSFLTALVAGLNEHIPGVHFIEAFKNASPSEQGRGLLALTVGGGLSLFSTSMNMVAYKLLRERFPGGAPAVLRFVTYSIPIAVFAFLLLHATYWVI